MENYIDLLRANKNLILTGAPGTGKTYLAKKIAKEMGAVTEFVQFHPSYDYTDFVEGLRPCKKEDGSSDIGFELRDGVFKSFCRKALEELVNKQVSKVGHAYSNYNIVNILDCEVGDIITYPTSKTFYKIAKKVTDKSTDCILIVSSSQAYYSHRNDLMVNLALKAKDVNELTYNDLLKKYNDSHNVEYSQYMSFVDKMTREFNEPNIYSTSSEPESESVKDYVIIIDEINRAEISKVFGELFFSIDPGYRGPEGRVKTQYSNLQDEDDVFYDGFYVPENVYIIGTMNDIDRSVESFDFAMRRRFAWVEIKAEDRISMWNGNIDQWKVEALSKMQALNAEIEKQQGLGSAFCIGPAYFLKLNNYNGDFEKLWNLHLEGVISEYLRGFPDKEKTLSDLKSAYENN